MRQHVDRITEIERGARRIIVSRDAEFALSLLHHRRIGIAVAVGIESRTCKHCRPHTLVALGAVVAASTAAAAAAAAAAVIAVGIVVVCAAFAFFFACDHRRRVVSQQLHDQRRIAVRVLIIDESVKFFRNKNEAHCQMAHLWQSVEFRDRSVKCIFRNARCFFSIYRKRPLTKAEKRTQRS
jgi:hypothetical protein